MKMNMEKIFAPLLLSILIVGFVATIPEVSAQTQFARLKVLFNVKSVTAFNVAIFSGTNYNANFTTNSTYPGNTSTTNYVGTTGDIMFNSTANTAVNQNPIATAGTAAQSAGNPILKLTNTGTANIASLYMNLSSTANCEGQACNGLVSDKIVCSGGTITLQAAVTFAGAYTQLTNTTGFQVNTTVVPGAVNDVYLQSNFSTVSGGTNCYADVLIAG